MQYLYYLLLRYILIIAPCLARPDGVGRDMGVHLVLSVERDDDACHVDCAAISSYIFSCCNSPFVEYAQFCTQNYAGQQNCWWWKAKYKLEGPDNDHMVYVV